MTRLTLEKRLTEGGIEDARDEALRLFCHYSGLSYAMALADGTAACADSRLEEALCRRLAGEPLAYILGKCYFYLEEYEVSPDCLIPRADTECLVEAAIARLPEGGRFADLCTGSGCIAISIAAHRPDTHADAFDISAAALALARRNAVRNEVVGRVDFFERDLLTAPVTPGEADAFPHAPYDLILSNPPYITDAEMRALPREVLCEPRLALAGGEDGLDFYRHFLSAYADLLTPDGAFLFEIGWQQGDGLRALAREGGFSAEILPDYGGRDRVAILTRARGKAA